MKNKTIPIEFYSPELNADIRVWAFPKEEQIKIEEVRGKYTIRPPAGYTLLFGGDENVDWEPNEKLREKLDIVYADELWDWVKNESYEEFFDYEEGFIAGIKGEEALKLFNKMSKDKYSNIIVLEIYPYVERYWITMIYGKK